MSFTVHQIRSRSDELASSGEIVEEALASGHAVDVVVPDASWAEERKLVLAEKGSVGANVQTYADYLEGAWELEGDGCALVSSRQRRLLLRPLLREVGLVESEPSAKFLDSCASFVEEAVAPGLAPNARLLDVESDVMELVELYARRLELSGLVEIAQAEARLDCGKFADRVCVVEEPPRACVHELRFLERLGESAEVHVFFEELPEGHGAEDGGELRELRARLYTGASGLDSGGAVVAGEAYGAHAESELVVELLRGIRERGAAWEDAVVALGGAEGPAPELMDELAASGIPFVAHVRARLVDTGLGSALVALESLSRRRESDDDDDEAAYEDLCTFLLSPYSGVAAEDARGLQERWREVGHSTGERRLADVYEGWVAGQANTRMTRERLAPAVELLDARGAERVRALFDNGKAAGLPVDVLVDDEAAAEAALSFIGEAEALGAAWEVEDLANVRVSLVRASGEEEHAVRFVDARSMGLEHAPWIVMGDLDAGIYPMASRPDVFENLRVKLGVSVADQTALSQRLLLANLVESSDEGFCFYRSLHASDGAEKRQSALWDELLAVYRGPGDEEAGLPVQEIPAALSPCAVRVSEADVFFAGGEGQAVPALRGKLSRGESAELLHTRLDGRQREFSPTQLEDYHRCPYLWFASKRVGWSALDRDLDQSSLGTLFHDTMAAFYPKLQETGRLRVTDDNLAEALSIAGEVFDAQVEENAADPRKGLVIDSESDRMEVERLKESVLSFVERDASFLPGYHPAYFEVGLASKDWTLEYATVPVRGCVDRIDVDDGGHAVVIDYKLSSLAQGYGMPKDRGPDDVSPHLQADIYARLVEKHFAMQGVELHVVGSVYRSYAANALRGAYDRRVDFGPVEKIEWKRDGMPGSGVDESYDEYLERVERTVEGEMKRLAEGDIAPNPIEKGACTYCKARPFCPRREG